MASYAIAGSYDTETCNIDIRDMDRLLHRAYPVLYILEDLRGVDLTTYEPDDGAVTFCRRSEEFLDVLEDYVAWGKEHDVVPVICAYNLMFDLQSVLFELRQRYEMSINAQSATNAYTLDLLEDERPVLRFWDCYHLEMNGLAAMGRTCGVAKATGDWDYGLTRTQDTPLTDEELHYATYDVHVIPAYLRYLLEAHAEWIEPWMFGNMVLTKTSLVRQMAKHVIGKLRVSNRKGSSFTLARMFELTCHQELPKTLESHLVRLACFRGGLTFTSALAASRPMRHVISLDVTSMHHTFICGAKTPVRFVCMDDELEILHKVLKIVGGTTRERVLGQYEQPFLHAFHAQVKIDNLRVKEGSCFELWGIGLLAMDKFRKVIRTDRENLRNEDADNQARAGGFVDFALDPTFAFGKLMSARSCTVFVNEIEWWCINQVYDFDGFEVVRGESTMKFITPPDYVTLQSCMLFERKSDAKYIAANYLQGEPYPGTIPATIPEGIAEGLRKGEISEQFFASWYQSTVKGMFNAIYGTQAQNVFKPDYEVPESCDIRIDTETRIYTDEELLTRYPKHPKVLYTYGMRIVGRSRMHLLIAMQMLFDQLGPRILVTGGDTDSLKIACADDVSEVDIIAALQPFHDATTAAIDATLRRVRYLFPELASDLKRVGTFDIEPASKESTFYDWHLEAWNKARISILGDHVHLTCAGVSRPAGKYNLVRWCEDLLRNGTSPELVMTNALGYNTTLAHDVCHALEHYQPHYSDRMLMQVTDYLGNTTIVDEYQAIALYPTSRTLGDTTKQANFLNVRYLAQTYRFKPNVQERLITTDGSRPLMYVDTGAELEEVQL